MRVLVTGSRDFTDEAVIHAALDAEYDAWLPTREPLEAFVVVHGKARGADTIAMRWAQRGGYAVEEGYEADWDLLGAHAGHERNAPGPAIRGPVVQTPPKSPWVRGPSPAPSPLGCSASTHEYPRW